jgi:ABC-type phosphate/phosphonate transport system substrate-binding protein
LVIGQRLFSAMNRNDVTAAMKAWLEVFGRASGVRLNSSTEVVGNGDDLRRRIREKAADLLVLDMWDYLPLADAGLAEAVAIPSSEGRPMTYAFVLLAGKGQSSLAGLRGKKIVVYRRTQSDAGYAWTTVLLSQSRLGRPEDFFGQIEETAQASSCVLPVFFGKAGACVVDEINWGLLRELNPQLGSALSVDARSPKILEGLVAMPLEPRHPQRDRLITGLLNLSQDPSGQQILILFRSGPLIPPDAAAIAGTRELWRQYVRVIDPPERGWPRDLPGPPPAGRGPAPAGPRGAVP